MITSALDFNGDNMTKKEYIDSILKTYDLVTRLSNKNGAEVLRLRHKTLGRDIVLRAYKDSVAAYEWLLGFSHPNLPEIYEVTACEDAQVVLEEFIEGCSVAQLLSLSNLRYRDAAKIIKDVCQALIPLHKNNIVHRDIKPENVIITKSGAAKLIDFNASRKFANGKSADTVMLGTIGYAPPEQLGITQSDNKTDIYALGVLLNVMLTRTHPSETLASGKAGKIVLKCTQIDPESRFQSAQRLMEAL